MLSVGKLSSRYRNNGASDIVTGFRCQIHALSWRSMSWRSICRPPTALALPPTQPDENSAVREHCRRASTTFGCRTEPCHGIFINDSRRSTSPSFWWCNEFETFAVAHHPLAHTRNVSARCGQNNVRDHAVVAVIVLGVDRDRLLKRQTFGELAGCGSISAPRRTGLQIYSNSLDSRSTINIRADAHCAIFSDGSQKGTKLQNAYQGADAVIMERQHEGRVIASAASALRSCRRPALHARTGRPRRVFGLLKTAV